MKHRFSLSRSTFWIALAILVAIPITALRLSAPAAPKSPSTAVAASEAALMASPPLVHAETAASTAAVPSPPPAKVSATRKSSSARSGSERKTASEAPTTRFAHAMVLAVDPETGQPGTVRRGRSEALTIEELQTLARLESQGLVTIRNADGSETINHEGRFTDYTVLRIGPDGKPYFECVQGEAGVEQSLRPDQFVRTAREEK